MFRFNLYIYIVSIVVPFGLGFRVLVPFFGLSIIIVNLKKELQWRL